MGFPLNSNSTITEIRKPLTVVDTEYALLTDVDTGSDLKLISLSIFLTASSIFFSCSSSSFFI